MRWHRRGNYKDAFFQCQMGGSKVFRDGIIQPNNGILFSNKKKCAIESQKDKGGKKIWRILKCILLSERSKYKMTTYCMIPII